MSKAPPAASALIIIETDFKAEPVDLGRLDAALAELLLAMAAEGPRPDEGKNGKSG